MSINLGLKRVVKLLGYIGNPQEKIKVLHVAGTNGKGSVCSYLTSILQQQRLNHVGKFTSPHLIHITDSITINNKPIPWKFYNDIRKNLDTLNSSHDLQCTEFELLTCTALKYFCDSKCDWCVIEVGLGGRLDATNVVPGRCKLACGITKIGLDHESFLGNTLPEIAEQKAGIITEDVPIAVVDGSNEECALEEVRKQCNRIGCELRITDPTFPGESVNTESWGMVKPENLPLNGSYQICNLRVALSILDFLQLKKHISISITDIYNGLKSVDWAGRLQELDYCYSSNRNSTIPLLLDGAHNGIAAIELGKFLRAKYGEIPLTFIIAVTSGKKLEPLLKPILRGVDKVVVTEFGEVDDMPWIHPTPSDELALFIKEKFTRNIEIQPVLREVIPSLASNPEGISNPIVVCGSLYLCGELLRIHNENIGTSRG